MDDDIPASLKVRPSMLGSFPSEILQNMFYFTTPTTFFQLIQVSRKFHEIAAESRELILHHLRHVPGIKLGLDDRSIPTADLFLIFRQRAASHLYGVHFTADCRSLEPSLTNRALFDPRASGLTANSDSCVVFQHLCRIRLNLHSNTAYGEIIDTPYGDGHARIIQVVQKGYYFSVLYAWTPPPEDLAEDTAYHEPAYAYMEGHDSRDGLRRRARLYPPKPSSPSQRVRYHLLHYDLFKIDRPVFFSIPTHKSLRGVELVPVHLAIHSRLQCAILWDLSDSVLPTSNATVCLYKSELLPRNERGRYDVWVIYPFDHPAPDHRPADTFIRDPDSDDNADGRMGRRPYTYTKINDKSTYDSDLRFLHFPLKPRSITFFKDGRRLSLYAPGSIAPYTTLLASEAIRTRLHPSNALPSWPISPGSTPWPRSLCRRIRRTNHTSINGHHFTLSIPFFSKHETVVRPTPNNHDPDSDDEMIIENDCITSALCIGTARIPSFKVPAAGGDVTGSGPEVLTIVQIRVRKMQDECLHNGYKDDLPSGLPRPPRERRRRRTTNTPNAGGIDLSVITVPDAPVDHDNDGIGDEDHSEPEVEVLSDSDTEDVGPGALNGTELRVVARLWGWNAQTTSLTGHETVSVSPKGERIAIALWDRVLVYALNPEALCEEAWDDGAGSDDGDSNEGSHSNSDSESDQISEISIEDHEEDGDVASIPGDVQVDEIDNADETINTDNGSDHLAEAPSISDPPGDPSPTAVTAPPTPAPPPPAPASVSSTTSTSPSHLANYYLHVKDKNFGGSTVLLKPIVLQMDGGGVVRKMSWAVGKSGRKDDEKEESGDEEDENEQEKETATEEQGQEKYGIGNDASDTLPLPMPQAEGNSSRQESTPEAPEINNAETEIYHQASSPSASKNTPIAPEEKSLLLTIEEVPVSEADHELPPAPFSDMKLTGQIKHISRPPEYNTISLTEKMYLDRPLDDVPRPSSLADSYHEDTQSQTGLDSKDEVGETERKQSGEEAADSKQQQEPKEAGEPAEDAKKVSSEADQAEGEVRPTSPTLPAQESGPAPGTTSGPVSGPPPAPVREPIMYIGNPPIPMQRARSRSRSRKSRKPRKRVAENELVVITDRGIQVWDLSVWGTGKRVRVEMEVGDGLG